jgi:CRP-like cAMP-binding protein
MTQDFDLKNDRRHIPEVAERAHARDQHATGDTPFLFSHLRGAADAASQNRLMSALTAADVSRSVPYLERVHLEQGMVLLEPRTELTHVWFPESCVASLTIPMRDGAGAEALTVGREGMLGFVAALGSRSTIACSVVQVRGTALRLPVKQLRAAFAASPRVRQIFLSYVEAVLVHLLQSVACNAVHDAGARLARWLLLFQDRLDGAAELPVTQELLARMLGVRRGTINAAARALERANLITTGRGRLTVQDRAGLEGASCECYGVLRERYEQLLPPAEAPANRSRP